MAMKTIAAIARVPWRPSHPSAVAIMRAAPSYSSAGVHSLSCRVGWSTISIGEYQGEYMPPLGFGRIREHTKNLLLDGLYAISVQSCVPECWSRPMTGIARGELAEH